MEKLLFVVNPISGGRDKADFKEEIESNCQARNVAFEIIETTGEQDHARIQSKLTDYQPETVVACGGDGTINLVAQILRETEFKMGIIPMGSANGLATDLEIPEDTDLAIAIILGDRVMDMDLLLVNEHYISLHLSDVGFNAKLIKYFEEGGVRGKWGYFLHFLRTIVTESSRKYQFHLPDQHFSLRAAMVVFANGRKYGIGTQVNPQGKMDDGLFEICIFKEYPWYAFFSLLFHFLTSQLQASPYFKLIHTKAVTVTTKKEASLQVDGEPLGEMKEVRVEIIPGALKVLVP